MIIKKYEVINLPFDKKISELTEKEARLFNKWFADQIPIRRKILKEYIKSEDKELFSKLDFSPESLLVLGKWFETKISTMKMTKEERKRERENLGEFSMFVKPKKWTFTEETFSLFFDIGIYFGTVFTKKFKIVKWTYVTKPKNYVDRNWPILSGFKTNLNPVRLVDVLANQLLDRTQNYSRLKELYQIWEKFLIHKK
ncbi:MAG: hypothetical protein AABX29_08500 [Nanoarchaeota archaeon]